MGEVGELEVKFWGGVGVEGVFRGLVCFFLYVVYRVCGKCVWCCSVVLVCFVKILEF